MSVCLGPMPRKPSTVKVSYDTQSTRLHAKAWMLFVRARKKQDGLTVPYTFLGAVDHESHKGDRPIAFVWKLRRPMPADFFRGAKVATA